MKREDIKKHIREDKKKKRIEVPREFYDSMAVYFINEEMHIQTVYKLIKIKSMDQMLLTMKQEVIKEYGLHEPTINKLTEEKKEEINRKLESKGLKERLR